MSTPKEITVFATTTNYPAGVDPWSGTAVKVLPGSTYLTPRVGVPAQWLNYEINAIETKVNQVLTGVGRGPVLSYEKMGAGYTDANTVAHALMWHPGRRQWFAACVNDGTGDVEVYRSENGTDNTVSDNGSDWSANFGPAAYTTGGDIQVAIGYGSGSARHYLLLTAGLNENVKLWDGSSWATHTYTLTTAGSSLDKAFVHSPTNGKTYLAVTNSAHRLEVFESDEDDLTTWASVSNSSAAAGAPSNNSTYIVEDGAGNVFAMTNRSTTGVIFSRLVSGSWTSTADYDFDGEVASVSEHGLCGLVWSATHQALFALVQTTATALKVLKSSDSGATWTTQKTFTIGAASDWKAAGPNGEALDIKIHAQGSFVAFGTFLCMFFTTAGAADDWSRIMYSADEGVTWYESGFWTPSRADAAPAGFAHPCQMAISHNRMLAITDTQGVSTLWAFSAFGDPGLAFDEDP